jgi:hypothetical protein
MTNVNSQPLGLVSEFHRFGDKVWGLSPKACDLVSKELLGFLREIDEVHHIPQLCASFSWSFAEDKESGAVICDLMFYNRKACDFDQNYIDTVEPETFISLLRLIDKSAEQFLTNGELRFRHKDGILEAYTKLSYTMNKTA